MVGTPWKYREFLKTLGGLNLSGEPNFVLMWGGDLMEKDKYPPHLFAHHLSCWVLAQWKESNEYGLAEDWPEEAGPFPFNGRYEVLQVFRGAQNPFHLESSSLNMEILGQIMSIILAHRSDSPEKRKQMMGDIRRQEQGRETQQIADRLEDAVPAFGGAEVISASGSHSRTSAVRKKMELIDQNFKRAKAMRRRPLGTSVRKSTAEFKIL